MPPRRLTWRALLPGLIAIGVLAAGALAVLVFARVGSLRGPTYRLYVRADEARGVIDGTEVWLAGQKVGVVSGVAFRPVSSDTLGRLIVALDVLRRYRAGIRRDSRVEFRAGGTPIGATIVAVHVGTPRSPIAAPGDTLSRAPQIDTDSVRAQLSLAVQTLPELLADVQTMSAHLQHNVARVHPPPGDRALSAEVVASEARRLGERITNGRGTLPLLIRDDATRAQGERLIARADSLLRLAREHGLPARLERDTVLVAALARVRNAIAVIHARMVEERGTAGRLVYDDTLARQLRALEANIDTTIQSLARGALAPAHARPARLRH
ncbi:MAG: MCE family protein [Gemmatimonadaceae bacterium]|nr:MCE family protein [Gemmatimonadaceae bacterium]